MEMKNLEDEKVGNIYCMDFLRGGRPLGSEPVVVCQWKTEDEEPVVVCQWKTEDE